MKITVLEPYFTGSHARWAEGYASRSGHRVRLLTLPGRHWKWRMHGGAVTLAGRFREEGLAPDIIIATDMLDLTTFISLAGKQAAGAKLAVYFHENQLSYPWPEDDPDTLSGRDAHYGFINIASALAADAAVFNSAYHRDSFLNNLRPFLERFPDYNLLETESVIRDRSSVLHLGLDLKVLDQFREERAPGSPPLILWNHRWEYDKNPEEFFRALFTLAGEGLDFRVALLGESFNEVPAVFSRAVGELGSRIVHSGYLPDRGEYASWLWKADILPVTSLHDFFGAGVVEAIYCNCCPVLPQRLAYPEHIPASRRDEFFYHNFGGLLSMLRNRIEKIEETRKVRTREFVAGYDWEAAAPAYDRFFRMLSKG